MEITTNKQNINFKFKQPSQFAPKNSLISHNFIYNFELFLLRKNICHLLILDY